MGIIQQQSIRSSAFILIGFAIGAGNMLLLYPAYFTPSQLGLTRAIIDTSLTLTSLSTLGIFSVIVKFNPFYTHYLKRDKNDLPFISLVICLLGFSLVLMGCVVFKDFIIRKLGKSAEFGQYFFYVFPYTFLILLFGWAEMFCWFLRKTTLTNMLKETVVRVITTFLILLFGFKIISFHWFIVLFSIIYLIPLGILIMALVRSGEWKFNIIPFSSVTRRMKKRMAAFGMFIFGAQFLNVLARTNDTFLIVGLRGLSETGIFSIAIYLTVILEIPQRSLNAISVPILSESWKNKDMDNIQHIYEKSVSNLLVIALALFGLIWLNTHNLIYFLNHLNHASNANYDIIESVVLVLGTAKLIDLGTGVNGQIIGTSNFWKFDFYTNVLYTALSLPINFFLVKYFGLVGLAFANLFALVVYNSVRYIFLLRKFQLQPYRWHHLGILSLGAVIFTIIYHIPQIGSIYLDTAIRTTIFGVLFIPALYVTKASPDIITMINKRVRLILSLKNKE